MKNCYMCKTSKDYSEFYKDRTKSDGYCSKCKDCSKEHRNMLRALNPEAARQYVRDWRKKHPRYEQEWRAKRPWYTSHMQAVFRAKQKGASFDSYEAIRDKMLSYKQRCANIECLTTENLTMDHMIPFGKGGQHTVDNVQILCSLCNNKKFTKPHDYTWAEWGIGYTYEGEA